MEILNNYKHKNAFLVQILVQNYLEQENKDNNIKLYGELINDIDVFNNDIKEIEIIKQKYKANNIHMTNPKTIIEFLTILDDNDIDYMKTIDVKYENELHLKDIINILTKSDYTDITKLEILFVSSNPDKFYNFTNDLQLIEIFNKFKQFITTLDNDNRYFIVNNIINNKSRYNFSLSIVFTSIMETYNKPNKFTREFISNIDNNTYNRFINNLNKFSIRELSLKSIIETQLSPSFIANQLGYYLK